MNPNDPLIIYEDSALLVVNKPAGLTVNKSDTTSFQLTLQDWVEERYKGSDVFAQASEHDFFKRKGIVHRLDKETSGVLLIAKTIAAFDSLQAQFKERTVDKTYRGLSHGKISPQEGEISVPVGRLQWNRKQFGIVALGRPAQTTYKTDAVYSFQGELLSLLTLYPKTGRTHQIRVHLKYLGHPVFSDSLYAGRKTARNDRRYLSRVFLHAYSISINHPVSNKHATFKADLAGDLLGFLAKLQIHDETEK